jgi:hypothetical protein
MFVFEWLRLVREFPASILDPEVDYRSSQSLQAAASIEIGEISGSHGDEYEDGCLLGCCAV